ncbi:MAG: GGDEF domain-containing protein [Myxococcales bacterium]|nr:GGDEF domain-containing protein [Myxococcales bacterium]MDH5307909.1 GGDEF domain-containing protein [Myxococcales bacterium]
MQDPKSQTLVLLSSEPSSEEGGTRTPVLVVVQGEEIGRRYLLNEPKLILGRDPSHAQLVIRDPSVSGKHALVQVDVESGRFGLIDMGSRNGTFVNGRRVDSSALREGDKIFLGETVLKFSFHDAIEEDFHSRLNELMHVDSLTGLYGRRWFDREYPKEFERARANGRPFSVLMMDMDGLKQINDRHGHQMGSYCISEAGALIRHAIEPNGVGARFGGDEFVAFLRNGGLDEALDLGEQIRRAIEAFEFRKGDTRVAPTISIGAAELEPGVQSAEELTRLADDALYRAKKAGRNRVSA